MSDAPSVLFACDPFADVPLTECSTTLCRQRDSVTTRTHAIAPCPRADLLVLHYVAEAA